MLVEDLDVEKKEITLVVPAFALSQVQDQVDKFKHSIRDQSDLPNFETNVQSSVPRLHD